jgi:hypothetical protein
MVRIERLRWDPHGGKFRRTGDSIECTPATLEGVQPGRAQPARRFLKGPVPWAWIIAASALPGKALLVGLCIWRLRGATKRESVVLGNADLEPLGIDRAAKSRALAALERAGLVRLKRRAGGFPEVTILEPHLVDPLKGPCSVR